MSLESSGSTHAERKSSFHVFIVILGSHRCQDCTSYPFDLARAITELHNPELRKQLGDSGAVKMATQFSWMNLAKRRLRDFTKALSD